MCVSPSLWASTKQEHSLPPSAAYCSAEPDESHKLAFLVPGAPRVRRLVNPPPRPKNNSLAIPTSVPSFPQATETKNLVLHDLIARRAEDARAVVTWCLSTHDTEAIRRMYNLIYRKAYALASVVVRLAARATVR